MGQPLEDFPTRWVGNQSLPILQPHDPRTGLQGHDRQFESSTQWIGAVHACAHNPTGVDLTQKEWEGLRQMIRNDKHQLPFFDSAYQGFSSGSLHTDAFKLI
ncbi:LOW QUALITY PROTEIN: hypothetical protein MARPO_0016s0032 [Marchantia polymorpha]|uniref:Aminotransferase class I/classII large domain-containing protein n=1 Tax=Marchantia polymorpha TaxID=3197 RepID=A0A2R6XFS5_MARPO|nr:LOW QUALITY PROTEIN: hypothetical protein MARPO_0016s0032 [Marchantia polymorpha]|eukprot:PTQ44960.1 LOW QUALITY PROTEIN: hypothetical protein MARPO_0016s0032 [Marchantia polymorpha]